MVGEKFILSDKIKIISSLDYDYYVKNNQHFVNGYAATEVYVVSKISGNLETIRYCIIDENYKEVFSNSNDTCKNKPEDYLKISRNNKKIIRIGDNDFCVTKIYYLENGSSDNLTLNFHIRLIDGKAEVVNNDSLGNYVTLTNVANVVKLSFYEDGEIKSCLYDVKNAKMITDKFSDIGEFSFKKVNDEIKSFSIVKDSYLVDDIEDEAMFKIDEKGNIISLIYFVNDNGDLSKANDPNVPGFNYSSFKNKKLKQMADDKSQGYNKIFELLLE